MLNTTDMDVIVYQGQVDLICLTKGANDWVLKLDPYWTGLDEFMVADRCVRSAVCAVNDVFMLSGTTLICILCCHINTVTRFFVLTRF